MEIVATASAEACVTDWHPSRLHARHHAVAPVLAAKAAKAMYHVTAASERKLGKVV